MPASRSRTPSWRTHRGRAAHPSSSPRPRRLSAAVVDELFAAVSLAARILTLQRDVERAVKAQNSMTLLAALGDVKAQLAGSSSRFSRAPASPSRAPSPVPAGRPAGARARRRRA
jgi:hypothetical protein